MLEIPGIDAEKVEIHGKVFLKLVKNAQQVYESMMQQQEDRVQDPNHMNVINISDDEELGNYDLDDLDDNGSQRERSAYFPPREVAAFNAEREYIQHKPIQFISDNGSSNASATSATITSGAFSKPRYRRICWDQPPTRRSRRLPRTRWFQKRLEEVVQWLQ